MEGKDPKYNWLFNEETTETPRDPNLDSQRQPLGYGDSTRKLVQIKQRNKSKKKPIVDLLDAGDEHLEDEVTPSTNMTKKGVKKPLKNHFYPVHNDS